MIEQVRELERPAKVAAATLLRPRSLAGLKQLIAKHGVDLVMEALTTARARAVADGKEPGFVRSWRYLDLIIADVKRRDAMEAEGFRPGDAWGANWRGAA